MDTGAGLKTGGAPAGKRGLIIGPPGPGGRIMPTFGRGPPGIPGI